MFDEAMLNALLRFIPEEFRKKAERIIEVLRAGEPFGINRFEENGEIFLFTDMSLEPNKPMFLKKEVLLKRRLDAKAE